MAMAMAMAIAVPSRLWLGGVCSAQRDKHLIQALAEKVKESQILCVLRPDPAADGRAEVLRERLAQSVPHTGAQRKARSSEEARLGGCRHRPGGQKA
jgi:hypothetical protein